jgi:ethanolamine transporter EutH
MSFAKKIMDFVPLGVMKHLTFSTRAALGFSLSQKDILTSIVGRLCGAMCASTVAIDLTNTDAVELYLLNSR